MNLVHINYIDNIFVSKYKPLIEKTFSLILLNEKIQKKLFIELSIIDSFQMKILNLQYRKINKTTDVLSFGSLKNMMPKSKILGEIFIDFSMVKKQSVENNISELEEFMLLFIHGVLHLLDYDHYDSQEKKIMFDKQNFFLDTIKEESKYEFIK